MNLGHKKRKGHRVQEFRFEVNSAGMMIASRCGFTKWMLRYQGEAIIVGGLARQAARDPDRKEILGRGGAETDFPTNPEGAQGEVVPHGRHACSRIRPGPCVGQAERPIRVRNQAGFDELPDRAPHAIEGQA